MASAQPDFVRSTLTWLGELAPFPLSLLSPIYLLTTECIQGHLISSSLLYISHSPSLTAESSPGASAMGSLLRAIATGSSAPTRRLSPRPGPRSWLAPPSVPPAQLLPSRRQLLPLSQARLGSAGTRPTTTARVASMLALVWPTCTPLVLLGPLPCAAPLPLACAADPRPAAWLPAPPPH